MRIDMKHIFTLMVANSTLCAYREEDGTYTIYNDEYTWKNQTWDNIQQLVKHYFLEPR